MLSQHMPFFGNAMVMDDGREKKLSKPGSLQAASVLV